MFYCLVIHIYNHDVKFLPEIFFSIINDMYYKNMYKFFFIQFKLHITLHTSYIAGQNYLSRRIQGFSVQS